MTAASPSRPEKWVSAAPRRQEKWFAVNASQPAIADIWIITPRNRTGRKWT